MVRLAHIINPVSVPPTSDLYVAQPITFQSIVLARNFARQQGIDVQCFTAQYEGDRGLVPEEFIPTPDLTRSILDVGRFQVSRPLPLIGDILSRLYGAALDADYLIYSNVDIALQPHFYCAIAALIDQGFDGFVINRRTITTTHTDPAALWLMAAEAGKAHPGHDCFIFPRSHYPRYQLGHLCIGASLIGMGLLLNLISQSQRFQEFRHLHLTFHLGDDRTWRNPQLEDYTAHNLREAIAILHHYQQSQTLKPHPLIQRLVDQPNLDYWLGRGNPQTLGWVETRVRSLKKLLKWLLLHRK